MYGHAVAELRRRGIDVPDELAERAHAGLRFLVRDRARDPESGLITVVHPWETGCDDSPRWDHYCPGVGFDLDVWRRHKIDLLTSLEFGPTGGPLANPAFGAASVSFNALTVWNARELASVTGDDELLADVDALVPLIEDRWDADLATWVDAGPGSSTSGRIRTADPLCALLVADDTDQRAAAVASLADSADHGGVRNPRRSPVRADVRPVVLLAGPVWPQLAYPLWRALDSGPAETEVGEELRGRTIAGAVPLRVRGVLGRRLGRRRRGDPAVLDRSRTRVGEDPHDLAFVVGIEAAHFGAVPRLSPTLPPPRRHPNASRLASALSGTAGCRRRARRLARTSAMPTRMMRSPNDTTCLANDRGIVSPNEASEVSASLNS